MNIENINSLEAIRRIELLFDNNFYLCDFIKPIHARFELRNLWKIAFNETLTNEELRSLINSKIKIKILLDKK